ncbi:hypothetical protein HMPREF9123_2118 [Neisseria bacilliformis ATCC BAA-1200]|uniref:Uncharacterized protein n=1 Tax=Neisseria bacilliformis ATCC BAA-1200 TaxID=888742 RepID=F2BEG2_9NEIS|nr:hypothetical protein HMPREF9123_2118 [Neisseria bacilliformis ATCC BAA-1200]
MRHTPYTHPTEIRRSGIYARLPIVGNLNMSGMNARPTDFEAV